MPKAPHDHPAIAIVYDRVNTTFGGAERVLERLHHLYPRAPIFTSVYDKEKASWAAAMTVIPSFLQTFPGAVHHHREYVGLMPLAFETINLDTYDIVISVTSAEAKGVITKADQLHICYLLTPTRYLWSHEAEYTQHPLIELVKRPIFTYLKWWDRAAALRPDNYIPISKTVAARCSQFYQRTPEAVIYPPVELIENASDSTDISEVPTDDYYLVVARLVGYKRIDLAISACAQAKKKLIIIGDGPERVRLQKLASELGAQATTTFLQAVQSTVLTAYYKNCRAFLAPGVEDFGIAALEAHLFGKPSVLHHESGAAEISSEGIASVHIREQTVSAVQDAIKTIEQQHWDAKRIKAVVAQHSAKQFEEQFAEHVETLWKRFTQKHA